MTKDDTETKKKGGRKEAEPEQSDRSQPSELILFLSKERITPTTSSPTTTNHPHCEPQLKSVHK